MEEQSSESSAVWVQRVFASAWLAFGALFLAMLLLVGVYLGVQYARCKPAVPWDSAVKVSDDGRFQPRFQQAILERFFSEEELIRGRNMINQRCDEARKEAVTKRRRLFGEVRTFEQQRFSRSWPTDRPAIPRRFDNSGAEADAGAFRMSANLKALSRGLTQRGGSLGLFEKDAAEGTPLHVASETDQGMHFI